MKVLALLGGLVVFAALVLGGFWLLVRGSAGDQSTLTTPVEVTTIDWQRDQWGSQRVIEGHVVTYRYAVDGQAFRGSHQFADREWVPGDTLVACVDPDDPTTHALVQYDDARCGEQVAPGIDTAEPA